MRHFFGDSCVPGLKGEKSSLTTICRNGTYEGEDGAIRCLIDGAGDVAFISKNSLKKFLAGKRKIRFKFISVFLDGILIE